MVTATHGEGTETNHYTGSNCEAPGPSTAWLSPLHCCSQLVRLRLVTVHVAARAEGRVEGGHSES